MSDDERRQHDLVTALAAQGVLNVDGGIDVEGLAERTDSSVEIVQNALAMMGLQQTAPAEHPLYVVSVDEHPEHQNIGGPGETVTARTSLLENETITPSPLIRALMRTDESAVTMMEELGTVAGQPLFVRVSYYSLGDSDEAGWRRGRAAALSNSPDLQSVFRVRFDTDLADSRVSIEAVRPDRRTAELLRVPTATPMVLRQVMLTDVHGVVRELSFTHFRADRVSVV